MWNSNEVTEIRERFADESSDVMPSHSGIGWARAFGTLTVLFVAAVAAGVLVAGCGSSDRASSRVSENAPTVSTQESATTRVASATPATVPSGLSAQDMAVREGLPPDLSVSVGDTLVAPGEVVEFTVSGTDDVTQVALSDGRDEPTPFVRDSTANVWRAKYRVPLKPRHDRLGVSVTARTGNDRWRRVWVFLGVDHGDAAPAVGTPIDNPDDMPEQDAEGACG